MTPTYLSGNFWWLQFRSGPALVRYSNPLTGALLMAVAAFADNALSATGFSFAAVILFATALFPEAGALKAYGFNKARSRRVLIPPAATAALIPTVTALVAHPNWLGVACAAAAVAAAAIWVAIALPDEGAEVRSGSRFALRAGRFRFEVFWRTNLYFAAATGLATGLLFPLSAHVGNEFLRGLLATVPAAVLWMRFAGAEDLRPSTARAYGLTRKAWAGEVLGVAFAANALFLVVALIGLLLIDAPAHTFSPTILTAAIGFVACFSGVALRVWFEAAAFMLPLFFWITMQYVLDITNTAGLDREMLIVLGAQSAIALLLAFVVLWLYISGRVDHRATAEVGNLGRI